MQFSVDGVWTQWTNWGVCAVTCATGVQQRTRTCTYVNPLAPKGKNCTGDSAQTKTCTAPQNCPGKLLNRIERVCSVTCATGIPLRTRTYFYANPVAPGKGKNYTGDSTDTKPCTAPQIVQVSYVT